MPWSRPDLVLSMAPRVIKLNVGGAVFHTAASTLKLCNFFDRLLSDIFSDLDTASGEVFVDRDGRYFHLILNYLRSGAVEQPPPPLTLEGAIAEAEYFDINGLVRALRLMAEPTPESGTGCDYNQMLHADGTGVYVWEDPYHKGNVEAVCFERVPPSPADFGGTDANPPAASAAASARAAEGADGATAGEVPAAAPAAGEALDFGGAASTSDSPGYHERGTLLYSRGPCAVENILATRAMPRPLPRIWRESADASTIVAFFTQRFISRGIYEREGRTLLINRGSLGVHAQPPGSAPASNISTTGVFLPSGDLMLLGPDGMADSRSSMPLLEQLGLAAGGTSNSEFHKTLGGSGLGGGFKRFVFKRMNTPITTTERWC